MRLFLSSYRAGKYPERLVDFFGNRAKIAVITNAKDYTPVDERKLKVKEVLDFFTCLGLSPVEIDLRDYFSDQKKLPKNLAKYSTFWLAGGNTFLLRRALRQSGLEPILGDLVRKNQVVLGGESAGAIIVGPTLRGAEDEWSDEDSPHFISDGYDKDIIWEGLDYIQYVPVPHYQSGDYGPVIDKYIKDLERKSVPFKTMTDDQAIIINGDKEEFLK